MRAEAGNVRAHGSRVAAGRPECGLSASLPRKASGSNASRRVTERGVEPRLPGSSSRQARSCVAAAPRPSSRESASGRAGALTPVWLHTTPPAAPAHLRELQRAGEVSALMAASRARWRHGRGWRRRERPRGSPACGPRSVRRSACDTTRADSASSRPRLSLGWRAEGQMRRAQSGAAPGTQAPRRPLRKGPPAIRGLLQVRPRQARTERPQHCGARWAARPPPRRAGGAHRRSRAHRTSAGTGREKRNPWAYPHPSSRRISCCTGSETPSAMTRTPRLPASVTMDDTT